MTWFAKNQGQLSR